jgi:hypothetical protein
MWAFPGWNRRERGGWFPGVGTKLLNKWRLPFNYLRIIILNKNDGEEGRETTHRNQLTWPVARLG